MSRDRKRALLKALLVEVTDLEETLATKRRTMTRLVREIQELLDPKTDESAAGASGEDGGKPTAEGGGGKEEEQSAGKRLKHRASQKNHVTNKRKELEGLRAGTDALRARARDALGGRAEEADPVSPPALAEADASLSGQAKKNDDRKKKREYENALIRWYKEEHVRLMGTLKREEGRKQVEQTLSSASGVLSDVI